MSENVLLGAMKVSTTRSTWERGGCSTGATGLAELMGLLLIQTKYGPDSTSADSAALSFQSEFAEIVPLVGYASAQVTALN